MGGEWKFFMKNIAALFRSILPTCLILLIARPWGIDQSAASISPKEKLYLDPLTGYSEKDRRWVRDITGRPTFLAARTIHFRANRDVFQFLNRNPDFAATISRNIGHEEFLITKNEGDVFNIVHGYAKGSFRLVERNPRRSAYLVKGSYDNPALSWLGIVVRSRAYVVESVKWASSKGAPSTDAELSIRVFLQIENTFLEPVFRLVSPLLQKAFEDKVTRAYRVAADLGQIAFEDSGEFLKKVEAIGALDSKRSQQFSELVRGQSRRHHSKAPH